MTSQNYVLPLKAPTPLPASGVESVTFKVWKNTLIAHIQQDTNHHNFMPGGFYEQWRAADYGVRIERLHEEDPDKTTIDGKRERLGAAAHAAELVRLLALRNAQLAKYITHIATLCHHTENDDVTNSSTSLTWIFDYLKKHYGLETKGANFMNIADHVFKTGTPYQTFYKQYRASFLDNLRKTGDVVKYRNNLVLTEDEKLSPSFENAIILWALEKIDPRLPSKVKKTYGHQMHGDVTLKDIQPVVFENISLMLEELDQTYAVKSFSAELLEDGTVLNAVNVRNRQRNNFRGSSVRGRGNVRPPFANKGANNPKNSSSGKFCRICNLAGSGPQIYLSHEIGDCGRLSQRDLDSIKNALVLNGLVSVSHDEPDDPTEPSYNLQPGWDDSEADRLQNDQLQE